MILNHYTSLILLIFVYPQYTFIFFFKPKTDVLCTSNNMTQSPFCPSRLPYRLLSYMMPRHPPRWQISMHYLFTIPRLHQVLSSVFIRFYWSHFIHRNLRRIHQSNSSKGTTSFPSRFWGETKKNKSLYFSISKSFRWRILRSIFSLTSNVPFAMGFSLL